MIHGQEKLIGLYDPWRKWCEWVLRYLSDRGYEPVVTSGVRTNAEQAILYKNYLAGKSKIPAAPPGRSAHNYGLAIDVVARDGDQAGMMRVMQSFGGELVEGDRVHVQYPGFSRYLRG